MGDWSEYFEDFPEENPENWVGGGFVHPQSEEGMHLAHIRQLRTHWQKKVAAEQNKLDREIQEIIQKHTKKSE